jgi:integrase
MARTVRDTSLDSRAARLRLKPAHKPYWKLLEQGQHIGYRRMQRGGVWYARFYSGAGKYAYSTLGNSDDSSDADGVAVLSYAQAQEAARKWFTQQARIADGLEATPSGPYTVGQAITDYLAWYRAHRKAIGLIEGKAKAHILPLLGEVQVARLTAKQIKDWHTGLAAAAARTRTRKGAKQATKRVPQDTDAIRKRRATANRVLTVLKSALNYAWREGRVATDDAWRRVKPFHNVDAPVIRYLNKTECVRLLNAAEPEHRPMFRAAMLTGCRYGELTALTAADVNTDAGMLTIRTSKSGKPRHVVLTEEAQQFFAKAVVGKSAGELIFTRPDGERWGHNHLQRPLTEACERAEIKPAISFHILRHTHGSLLAMQGVPLPVISKQLGHADTRMTERHYAHLAPDYVADTIRASLPVIGGKADLANLATLHKAKR